MPFDSEPAAEVTARDRMVRLRDFLANLDFARFNMDWWHNILEEQTGRHTCGTVACIGGWAVEVFGLPATTGLGAVGAVIGLDADQAYDLFYPGSEWKGDWGEITLEQAVAVLDHYLATLDATGVGVIDWSVAADQPAKREPEPAR